MEKKTLVAGIALFSMFFGGGNLIYPLAAGLRGQDNIIAAFCGFAVSGVVLPFVAVLVILVFNGRNADVFKVLWAPLRPLFPFLLLLFWIPLGSAPRCISLVASSWHLYGLALPLWAFVGLYSALSFSLCCVKSRVIGILGYIMTPVIVVAIAAMLFATEGPKTPSFVEESGMISVFIDSARLGLKTQDFIAAFFFSSVILDLLGGNFSAVSRRKFVLRTCLIGMSLLSLVYLAMIYCGFANSISLRHLKGDELLFGLIQTVGGGSLSALAIIVISFSCLSTTVALTAVFANFLEASFPKHINFWKGALISSLLTAVPALFGFEVISSLIGPSMDVLYPCLLVISIWASIRKVRGGV